jgi:hypothetical protein
MKYIIYEIGVKMNLTLRLTCLQSYPFALSVAAIRVLARVQLCKVDSGRS